jgi:hypothetical protein
MQLKRSTLSLFLGLVLIGIGVLYLAGRWSRLLPGELLWPVILLISALACWALFAAGGANAGPLAVAASLLSAIGLVSLYEILTGDGSTWSYSWALVIAALGAGLALNGKRTGQPALRRAGSALFHQGIFLFILFGLLSSLLWNDPQRGYGLFGLLATVYGLYLLVRRSVLLLSRKATREERDLFWPVILIGAGLLFVLSDLGGLPLNEFSGLQQWWPLGLILIGFDWLLGRRLPLLGALVASLIVAGSLILMFDPAWLGLF